MKRLSFATLDTLPRVVARPAFDPRTLPVGIVHLKRKKLSRATISFLNLLTEEGPGTRNAAASVPLVTELDRAGSRV